MKRRFKYVLNYTNCYLKCALDNEVAFSFTAAVRVLHSHSYTKRLQEK